MAVQIKESSPVILPGRVGEMNVRPEGMPASAASLESGLIGEGALPKGQLNTDLAAMEADTKEILQSALEQQQSSSPGKAERSDKAELSEEAKNRELSPEQKRILMSEWTLEQLGKDWLLLLNFMPGQGEDIALLLDKLFALFHLLEAEILENTYGPAQQREMTKLERAFSAALNRIWLSVLPDITAFFEEFGSKSQLEWLKSGTYYLASGERLPERKLERFWQAGREASRGSGEGGSSGKPGSYEAFTRKGVVYQPRGREITFMPETKIPLSGRPSPGLAGTLQGSGQLAGGASCGRQMMKESSDGRRMMTVSSDGRTLKAASDGAAPSVKAYTSHQPEIKGMAFTPGKQGTFSALDLKNANSFVKNFVAAGGVFPHQYLNSRHEELLGVLSAIASMKCREFCTATKMGTAMGSELQTAADRYIEQSIRQSADTVLVRGDEKLQQLQQKEIYKTYYYTMDKYQADGKADRAILEGLKYAVEVFREKKLNTLFPKQRYGVESEFFHTGNWNGQDVQVRAAQDLRYGAEILEKDWNNFLKYMGKSHEKMVSLAALLRVQRPQGTVLDQPAPEVGENTKNYRLFLLISSGIFVLAIVLAWIFLY